MFFKTDHSKREKEKKMLSQNELNCPTGLLPFMVLHKLGRFMFLNHLEQVSDHKEQMVFNYLLFLISFYNVVGPD